MRRRRRTEVTVETERVFVVAFGAPAACPTCGPRALMLAAEEAARRARTTTRAVFRRVEGGALHFIETADGRLLVCPESLAESLRAIRED